MVSGLPTLILLLVLSMASAGAAPRQHTVFLGPWRNASVNTESGKTVPIKLRNLLVDNKFKEHTAGPSHEVTDRLFVVRKAAQLNDSLPEEASKTPRWVWRLEGWIGVDRQTGRVTQINLPMFDLETSEVSWYRDLAAYCGSSDDRGKTYLMVFPVGQKEAASEEGIHWRTMLNASVGTPAHASDFPEWVSENQLCCQLAWRRSSSRERG